MLELIAVLALLGLVLAIAAPSLILPSPPATPDFGRAIDAARRAAVLRGEPVTLLLTRDGSWRVVSGSTMGDSAIASGTLRGPTTPLRIHISPLGTCIPELVDGAASLPWNAVGCSPGVSPNGAVVP